MASNFVRDIANWNTRAAVGPARIEQESGVDQERVERPIRPALLQSLFNLTEKGPQDSQPSRATMRTLVARSPAGIGRAVLACAVWATLVTGQCNILAQEPATTSPALVPVADQEIKTVTLRIDYGNGFSKVYDTIPWYENQRVTDLMTVASQHAQPTKFAIRGEGQTAFLTSIDGIENRGFGKKSWIFYVNGTKGEASFATVELSSSDSILWKYQKFP